MLDMQSSKVHRLVDRSSDCQLLSKQASGPREEMNEMKVDLTCYPIILHDQSRDQHNSQNAQAHRPAQAHPVVQACSLRQLHRTQYIASLAVYTC